MRYTPWLQRAGWLTVLVAAMNASAFLRADDDKPAEDKSSEAQAHEKKSHDDYGKDKLKRDEIQRIKEEVQRARHRAEEDAKRAISEAKARIAERSTLRFMLRMHVKQVPQALDDQLQLHGEGLLVYEVAPEGAAAKADVKVNDVLLSVNDKPVKDLSDLMQWVDESDGKPMTFKVMRAGKTMTLTVTPEKREEKSLVERGDDGIYIKLKDLPDLKQLEGKIREELKRAGVDARLQLFGPGVVSDGGGSVWRNEHHPLGAALPDDVSVTIRKQGKEPAQVEVKRGDQTWTIAADELDKLPEDIRKPVAEFLSGRAQLRALYIQPPKPPTAAKRPEGAPGPTSAERREAQAERNLERRLDEMNQRLDKLRHELEGLRAGRHDGDKDEPRPSRR